MPSSTDEKYQRQREKQLQAKLRLLERQREKQRARMNDGHYLTAQREKQIAAGQRQQQRQWERQQQQMADPVFRQQQQQKAYEAARRQQEKQALQKRAQKTPNKPVSSQNTGTLNAEQAQQARQQQAEKLKQKQADPAYQAQQLTKQRLIQQKRRDKQLLKQQQRQAAEPKARTAIKSKGLKGRSQTAAEKRLANKLAVLGCICCRNQGWISEAAINEAGQQYISLHHVEGRSKPWAHAMVLPLCHFHHQTEAPADAPAELFPLHGNAKTRWESINGTQSQLLKQVYDMIGETRPWLATEPA